MSASSTSKVTSPTRRTRRGPQTDLALASAAALVRRCTTPARRCVPPPDATWSSEMADPEGGPLICHNDVCLENLVYRDQVAVGLLDFDFAAPGRRLYDLAQFARMNVPMDSDDDAVLLGRTPAVRSVPPPAHRRRRVRPASGRGSSSTWWQKGSGAAASSCSVASTKATRRSSRWSRPAAVWRNSTAAEPGPPPPKIVSPRPSAARPARRWCRPHRIVDHVSVVDPVRGDRGPDPAPVRSRSRPLRRSAARDDRRPRSPSRPPARLPVRQPTRRLGRGRRRRHRRPWSGRTGLPEPHAIGVGRAQLGVPTGGVPRPAAGA